MTIKLKFTKECILHVMIKGCYKDFHLIADDEPEFDKLINEIQECFIKKLRFTHDMFGVDMANVEYYKIFDTLAEAEFDKFTKF